VIVLTLFSTPISHMPTCWSLIQLNPVVAIQSWSPIQNTRVPLMPPWLSLTRTASPPVWVLNRHSLQLWEVVVSSCPIELNARLWMPSLWPASTALGIQACPGSSFTVWSPTALVRTCYAARGQSTSPTFHGDVLMCNMGRKSTGVQSSEFHPSKAL
jgi:hypothetical protein